MIGRMHPLRDNPWSKQVPASAAGPYDTIVIGSGMGGMTCAALLSQAGERVLVLEQHYVAGGFTHAFHRQRWSWDVGVHAIGEVTRKSVAGRLLSHLTGGRLRWASLGSSYDEFSFPGGFRIAFPDTPAQFRANLVAAFPHEAPAIDRYLQKVRAVSGAMRGYFLARLLPQRLGTPAERLLSRGAQDFLGVRTAEVLAALTDDARLRTVLTAQWGYYGSVPSRSPFAMQALVARHFLWGGYYPVGGAQRISAELLRTVADAGGWTRVRADVSQILTEGGRAVGVRLADGEELRAGRVVSAVGIRATAERLLPKEARGGWADSVVGLTPAPAHVCLYIGFRGDIRAAGAGPANQWFFETWDTEAAAWDVAPDRPVGRAPVLYCSFPSLKDPTHDPGPEQLHTGEVVTFVPWSVFARWREQRWHRRDAEYQAFKDRLAQQLLAQLLENRPGLSPHVAYTELSTPVTTDHFVRPVQGSIYGLAPTLERFRNPHLRPRSPVPGLYFAGSEVASVGVMGAMLGGVMAAVAASPRRVLPILAAASRR